MRLVCLLLLLAGCTDGQAGDPGSANVRLNGFYSTFVGGGTAR